MLIFIHEFIMKQADLNAQKLSEPLSKKVSEESVIPSPLSENIFYIYIFVFSLSPYSFYPENKG